MEESRRHKEGGRSTAKPCSFEEQALIYSRKEMEHQRLSGARAAPPPGGSAAQRRSPPAPAAAPAARTAAPSGETSPTRAATRQFPPQQHFPALKNSTVLQQ